MNLSVERRVPCRVRRSCKKRRIVGKKLGHYRCRRSGSARVPRGKSGVLRVGEYRNDCRIGLAWPKLKICILRIPAGERRVVLCDGLIGVSPRSARRVEVQMVLKDLLVHLVQPFLKEARLPEPGQMIGIVRANEVLDGGVLDVGGVGAERRWRTRAEIVGSIQHPRLPCAGQRRHWIGAAPYARRRRIGSAEDLAGAVALSVSDYRISDVLA